MSRRKPYRREMPRDFKTGGVVTFMAAADGYVMCRRPGRLPFVVSVKDWNAWPEVASLSTPSTSVGEQS